MPSSVVASDEKKTVRIISGILRATRKQMGLSQVALARQMGISQGALSKIESGQLTLDAPQWVYFCQLTGVQLNSAITGYVDFQRPSELRDDAREHGFRLPLSYTQHRGSTVRALLPLITYFRSVFSEEEFVSFLGGRGVDPDFFVNLGNQINLNFFLDTTHQLRTSGHLNPGVLEQLTTPIGSPQLHGQLHSRYDQHSNPVELMSALIQSAPYYECNFNYSIEESSPDSIVIGVTPNAHVEEFKAHPGFDTFLCEYRKNYFHKFSMYKGSLPPGIRERQCIFKGAPSCVFELKWDKSALAE